MKIKRLCFTMADIMALMLINAYVMVGIIAIVPVIVLDKLVVGCNKDQRDY